MSSETPSVAGRRRFSLEDQELFAALSGDWNPLHVDVQAARRTMLGAPVVHGVHLLLWTLEASGLLQAGQRIAELNVAFRRPAYLDEELVLVPSIARPGSVTAFIGGETSLELRLEVEADLESTGTQPPSSAWPQRVEATELPEGDLSTLSGAFPLALDRERLESLFPRLARTANPYELADLLATTRLVGMYCPGMHSLYSGLLLKGRAGVTDRDGPNAFQWNVARFNAKYSTLKLAVQGAALEGTLDTFVRPRPQKPLGMAHFAQLVTGGEFAGQRAVIVGGSRGIGEAFAKAIAAGGGELLLTYRSGREEAERVCRDIREAGGQATTQFLDVTSSPTLENPWGERGITHVYYFATPFIKMQKGKMLDASAFLRFLDHYVLGLQNTIETVQAISKEPLVVYSPSTVFLDSTERGAAAYCAAKAAMEELGRHWSLIPGLRVLTPRLPKTRTDQTVGLVGAASADPIQLAIDQLRNLG
jgi:hypothetical protein